MSRKKMLVVLTALTLTVNLMRCVQCPGWISTINLVNDPSRPTLTGAIGDDSNEVVLGATDEVVDVEIDESSGLVTHIWDRRDELCAGFSSQGKLGSLYDCFSEAIMNLKIPDCNIETELTWDLRFADQIELSTGNVTDTNFYLGTCPSEGGQETRFLGITLEDLRILEIAPSPVLTFPEITADNPRIIHMPVVVYTNSEPQFFSPTLLDQTVQVRVVPAAFTFDWGDGEVLGPVASPGVPDVDSGYQHSYSSLEPVRISVTTQWSASWSLDGQTWIRVPGFLSTTNTTPELPIVEKVPMLVPSS